MGVAAVGLGVAAQAAPALSVVRFSILSNPSIHKFPPSLAMKTMTSGGGGGGGGNHFSPVIDGWRSRVGVEELVGVAEAAQAAAALSVSIQQIGDINNNYGGGGFGKGGGGNGGDDSNSRSGGGGGGGGGGGLNPFAAVIEGWRSRVAADPDFPFKVLMEELVGVFATAVGVFATRPNFGLGELDFVLSNLVVGSIVNFTLMYLLAPTLTSTSSTSLPSYIFEPGPFPLSARLAALFYKGLLFAAVGFASGLTGTAISNGLVAMTKEEEEDKKKMRLKTVLNAVEFLMSKAMPEGVFKATAELLRWAVHMVMTKAEKEAKKKKVQKTVVNAATWAAHMGVSSNLRYQTLNAAEFLMAKAMPVGLFKAMVVVLRCLNNVAGGMSFVLLGRLMGSQKGSKSKAKAKRKKTEEEKTFRRRAKYFLATQLVAGLLFWSLFGGDDNAEEGDEDELDYDD